MAQKDIPLLLKDLYARLPYGVKVNWNGGVNYGNRTLEVFGIRKSESIEKLALQGLYNGYMLWYYIEECKPYLRPMSSMTEDEKKIYKTLLSERKLYGGLGIKIIDWLNAHHFDYRGLIEKGLALEAPKDMYNLKEN